MYKVVLFDFDGTLLDSDQMLVVTFQELYSLYSKDYHPSIEHMLTFSGPPIKDTLAKEFPHMDQDFMMKEYLARSTKNYDKYVKPFPYVKEMLLSLKDNNIKFGLITSKAKDATNYALKLTGLDGLFEFIICADEVKNVKPDPEGILLALKHFNVKDKSETIYIGDTMYDYLTAKNANVPFGFVTFSPRKMEDGLKYDLTIDSFKNFVEVIKNEKH